MIALAVLVALVAAVRGMWSPCGLSMLSSLNPVAERARGHRFAVTASWYVAGAVAGGALLGGGCAVAALGFGRLHLDADWTWAIALAGAVVAVVSDSPLVPVALPDHPRQVDVRWLTRYRRWIYAGGFGVQIGTGFATYIMTAAVYLAALLATLTGRPAVALAVGLTFGLVRGLAVLVPARTSSPEALRRLLGRVDRLGPAALRAAAGTEAAVAAVAGWTLGGPLLATGLAVPLALLATGRPARQPKRAAA